MENGQAKNGIALPPGTMAFACALITAEGVSVILPAHPTSWGDIAFLSGLLDSAKLRVQSMTPGQGTGLVLPGGPMPPLR